MHPYINIFGKDLPTFTVLIILGIAAGFLLIYINCRLRREKVMDPILTAAMAVVGGFVGAMLFRPITRTPDLILNWGRYSQIPVGQFFSWLFGEMVFYGGLIGGVIAAWLFCR
ncbi:MAG: prolipoprotein diacylglyceryl transferase, partial [Oscillospiraceae bacterium]|nr:prolipoprotein diacylglyceryl transferase [Oscillospiraceae bacterium]